MKASRGRHDSRLKRHAKSLIFSNRRVSVETDLIKARQFCELLYTWLCHELSDASSVLQKVREIESHAPGHAETRFCKGCVLPIIDKIATQYLSATFALNRE